MPYDPARYRDKWRLERLARAVRERLGLSQTDLLDPRQLADAVPAHVFYPEDLVPPALAARLRGMGWDGGAFTFPDDDTLMVLLNPARPRTRQSATLLEELAHHLLRHQPTRIYSDPDTGLRCRDYNKTQEAEAYDFGSTLLLPKEMIQRHVKEVRGSASSLAEQCGCSVALVEFRIKKCRLWDRYKSTCAA